MRWFESSKGGNSDFSRRKLVFGVIGGVGLMALNELDAVGW
jgi:hypothetical protein